MSLCFSFFFNMLLNYIMSLCLFVFHFFMFLCLIVFFFSMQGLSNMSSGKANSGTVLSSMKARKPNTTRAGRELRGNPRRYPSDGVPARGRGRGGGGRGGGGGVDFDPPPSASGDEAPHLFLEGPGEPETEEPETEERTEGSQEGSEAADLSTEPPQPKKVRTRGEAGVPDERREPKTEADKALIIPKSPE